MVGETAAQPSQWSSIQETNLVLKPATYVDPNRMFSPSMDTGMTPLSLADFLHHSVIATLDNKLYPAKLARFESGELGRFSVKKNLVFATILYIAYYYSCIASR